MWLTFIVSKIGFSQNVIIWSDSFVENNVFENSLDAEYRNESQIRKTADFC